MPPYNHFQYLEVFLSNFGIIMKNPPETVTRYKPLDRVLQVLGAVAGADRPLSMTEIANQCELPLPSVHRLVAELTERGLLGGVLGSKKLVIGPALVSLGAAALNAAMRANPVHEVLVGLSSRLGEDFQVAHRVDDDLVYLDVAHAARSQGLRFEQGRHSPLHCTSIGKLFLAEMPEEAFERWLARANLARLGPNTIVSRDKLREVVAQVRQAQWASNNEEIAAGVVGCAVPIRVNGRLVAGLGISVPSARVKFSEIEQFRAPMQEAADEIGARLAAVG